MALIDALNTAYSDDFRWKVNHFFYKAAVAIMAEPATTPHHAERAALANHILQGGFNVNTGVVAVLTNPAIEAKLSANQSADGDLEFVVNSLYNAMAGIHAGTIATPSGG